MAQGVQASQERECFVASRVEGKWNEGGGYLRLWRFTNFDPVADKSAKLPEGRGSEQAEDCSALNASMQHSLNKLRGEPGPTAKESFARGVEESAGDIEFTLRERTA